MVWYVVGDCFERVCSVEFGSILGSVLGSILERFDEVTGNPPGSSFWSRMVVGMRSSLIIDLNLFLAH